MEAVVNRQTLVDQFVSATGMEIFANADLVKHYGCSGAEASKMIQAHLSTQRNKWVVPQFALVRYVGRTRSALWRAGNKNAVAKAAFDQFVSDTACKAERNPKAVLDVVRVNNVATRSTARQTLARIDAVLESLHHV